MKKLMTLLFMYSLVFVSQAQEVLKLPSGFTDGKTIWIVRAGASFSGVSGDGIDAQERSWTKGKWDGSFKRAFGGNLSIGFNKHFGSSPMYWGMDLGVAMRGYKTDATWSYGASSSISGGYDSHTKSQTTTLTAYNAQLSPINIGYKCVINDNMAIDIHVGGFASYDFAGNLKSESYDHIYLTGKYGTNDKTTEDSNSTKIGDIDNYRNYDFGVIGGVGFWYGRFNVDVSYQRGFISIYDTDDSYFCNKFQVRIGYAL